MPPEITLNVPELIQGQVQAAEGRMLSMGFSADDVEECSTIISQFGHIAADMIVSEEDGIAVPGSKDLIPYDNATIEQTMRLFYEGILYAITKCQEMKIGGDERLLILQQVALEVYNQAKQVVASTYGQEATPQFQITEKQQSQIMHQGAENHLLFFINEYEKAHDIILGELPEPVSETAASEAPVALSPKARGEEENWPEEAWPEEAWNEDWAAQPDWADKVPARPAAASPVKKTHHDDKYAAVALLLTALPSRQQQAILQNFSPEEQSRIQYYSEAEHIAGSLDLASVNNHLRQFQALLRQGLPSLRSRSFSGIQQLAQAHTARQVLSCIEKERPRIRAYTQYACQKNRRSGLSAPTHGAAAADVHFEVMLPPKIEEVLYQYLNRKLSKS